jgi:uncharacterized membrane protein YhfC
MRVPVLSIIYMALSVALAFGVPVILVLFLRRRFSAPLMPFLTGVGAFVLFVVILEQMIHRVVLGNFNLRGNPFLYMLYGGFAAGIFEESARFICLRLMKRRFNRLNAALSYGAGHGGIEAVLLGGFPILNNLILSLSINAGTIGEILTPLDENVRGTIVAQIAALTGAASPIFLMGGMERVFALVVQMSLSVIVFYAVFGYAPPGSAAESPEPYIGEPEMRAGRFWLYPLAVVLHALVDFPAALMQAGAIQSVYLVEGLVGLSALALVWIAMRVHTKLGPGSG